MTIENEVCRFAVIAISRNSNDQPQKIFGFGWKVFPYDEQKTKETFSRNLVVTYPLCVCPLSINNGLNVTYVSNCTEKNDVVSQLKLAKFNELP